jgi:CheY-like chemotaxis protein
MPIALHLAENKKAATRTRAKEKEKEAFLPEDKTSEPVSTGAKHRILVVDDNPVVLKAFELKLKATGFEVATTPNSAAVARTAEEVKAELIILDINFPDTGTTQWNGFTIIQWLRRFGELANIPIILMTGGEIAEYKEKCLAAGAIAFFQKPFDFKDLVAVIRRALEGKS